MATFYGQPFTECVWHYLLKSHACFTEYELIIVHISYIEMLAVVKFATIQVFKSKPAFWVESVPMP